MALAIGDSSNRRGSRGEQAKTHSIAGGSIGNGGEEKEVALLEKSRQEQQGGPLKSRAPTLNTKSNQLYIQELLDAHTGMLQEEEKCGGPGLVKGAEKEERSRRL